MAGYTGPTNPSVDMSSRDSKDYDEQNKFISGCHVGDMFCIYHRTTPWCGAGALVIDNIDRNVSAAKRVPKGP